MSIASQITTMQEHIEDIYDTFAVAGVDTSAAAKNIVNINANLKERLEYYLANGLDVVWDNWSKVSGSGTTLSLNNTIQAKMDFVYKGNTSQSILPSGYTQVDYITSDGNSYIDTGKALGDNFKIETKFIHNQQSSNEQPIISTWVNSYAWFNLYIASNNQLRFYAAGNHMTANPTLTIGNINTVSYSRNSNEWVGTLNGEEVTFTTELTSSNPTTFKILARGDGTKGSYVSIYRLKLFENNILTMDLIPCYRNSDNVIGMYDIVNNIFYTNSGTGNFTYGSVAPTPECPIPVNVVTGDNEVKVEGKNLFNANNYMQQGGYNGISIKNNKDGSYTITGTATGNVGLNLTTTPIILKNGETYTQSIIGISGTQKGSLVPSFKNSQGQIIYNFFSNNQTKTTTDVMTLNNYDYFISNGTTVDFTFKVQLEQGSSATEFQLYQSQTYPINLGVKNLIDLINFAPISNNTVVSLIDNGINVNNTSSGYGAKIQLTDLKANTDYYISYNWKNISNGANRVVVFAGTGTSATLASFNNLNGGTFNTGDNTTINIWFYAAVPGIAEVEYTNIQLEEGTVKHSYTPSWFESIELCKIGDYQDYIAKSTGKNLFDASAISNSNIVISNKGAIITMPIVSSGNGITSTNTTLQELCPDLKVGDTVYLEGATTSAENTYIFLGSPSSFLWHLGLSRTITQNDLNSAVNLYGNRYSSGETNQVVISNLRIVKNSTDVFEPYGKVWYKYGAIGKTIITTGEQITHYNNLHWISISKPDDSIMYQNFIRYPLFMQTAYYSEYNTDIYSYQTGLASMGMGIMCSSTDTIERLKPLIDGTLMYYPLATPTITEITDTTLISQLEAIKLSYNEQTNISQTNTDKPFILDVTALKDLDAEDTTPALTINRELLFTQPPVSENFINDEDDNSILEETINEEEPNIEDDNREEEEPVDFFEKEIINNGEEQGEKPIEPIEIDIMDKDN